MKKAVLIHRKKAYTPQEPAKSSNINEDKAKRGGVIAENKKEGEEALSGKKPIKIVVKKSKSA